MRKSFHAALFCVLLAAASGAAAQASDPVYSVEGWPRMGTRADGKLELLSFHFDVASTTAPGATTKASSQIFRMTIATGDPATLFARAAHRGEVLKSVLIEAFPANKVAKPVPPAPFAARLSEVRVTSVDFSGSRAGSTAVGVTLQAARLEIFSASQTATGAMKAGPQTGFDFRAGKPLY